LHPPARHVVTESDAYIVICRGGQHLLLSVLLMPIFYNCNLSGWFEGSSGERAAMFR